MAKKSKVEDTETTQWWRKLVLPFKSTNKNTRYGAWGLGVLLVLSVLYLIYSLAFLGQVYPNVKLGSHSFAGLTRDEVKAKVAELVKSGSEAAITLRHNDQTQAFTAT